MNFRTKILVQKKRKGRKKKIKIFLRGF